MSPSPGQAPPTFIRISRTARPIVALACQPGPKTPDPLLSPIRLTIGPLTISRRSTGFVVGWSGASPSGLTGPADETAESLARLTHPAHDLVGLKPAQGMLDDHERQGRHPEGLGGSPGHAFEGRRADHRGRRPQPLKLDGVV